jgi:hypothetical protein
MSRTFSHTFEVLIIASVAGMRDHMSSGELNSAESMGEQSKAKTTTMLCSHLIHGMIHPIIEAPTAG